MPLNCRTLITALTASVGFAAGSAGAAVFTWTGNSSANWNTNANWIPATGFPGNNDTVVITGTPVNDPRQNLAVSFDKMTFDSSLAANVQTQSSDWVLDKSNTTFLEVGNNNRTIDVFVSRGAAPYLGIATGNNKVLNNGTGSLSIGANPVTELGEIRPSAAGGGNYTIDFDGSGRTFIAPGMKLLDNGTSKLNVVKNGTGTLFINTITANSSNTYTGTTSINAGTVSIPIVTTSGVRGPLGNATSAISMGNTGGAIGTLEYTGATATSNRSFTAVTGGTAGFSTSNASTVLTLSGTIGGNGNKLFSGNGSYSVTGVLQGSGSVTKNGTGTLTLVGTKTYTGATNVSGGTLALSSTGSFSSSPVITVAAGATLDVTAVSGGFSLSAGQAIKGTGSVLGDLVLASGSILSPGNSPGNLVVTGNSTWAGNATYVWEINDALGSAGNTTTGWDLQTITGNLSVTATSGIGDQFIIDIVGLNASNVAGQVVNWDNTQNYAWLIADAGVAVDSFALNKFALFTGNFTNNNNTANGTFGIARGDSVSGGDNTQIYLTFTAVPEPTALALAALGLAALGVAVRRRRP